MSENDRLGRREGGPNSQGAPGEQASWGRMRRVKPEVSDGDYLTDEDRKIVTRGRYAGYPTVTLEEKKKRSKRVTENNTPLILPGDEGYNEALRGNRGKGWRS